MPTPGFTPADSPVARSPSTASSSPPPVGITARRDFSVAKLWQWLKNAWDLFGNINGTLWAASFAYYAFFALFPLLIFLVTVAAHFTTREQAFAYIVTNVEKYMPLASSDRDMIAKTVNGVIDARGSIGLVSLAGLLWSALGFFQALVGAVNAAWKQQQPNWWRLPLKNLTLFALLVSTLLLGNFLPVVSKTVQGYLNFTGWLGPLVFATLNLLLPTVVLFYGFLFFYKITPRRASQTTFSLVWLPALIVAALLQVAQYLFVIYTTNFAKFNAVYGTFGGVIALMLWIYLSGIVMILGGCLCAARHSAPDAAAAGEKPARAARAE